MVPDCSHLISYSSPCHFSSFSPTGLFAVLQLCRHMPPSRSLTFLLTLPGILSLAPAPYSPSPTCSTSSITCLSLSLTHSLSPCLVFSPGPCAYLVCQGTMCCLPPPTPRMLTPYGRNFSMLFLPRIPPGALWGQWRVFGG